VAKLQNLTGGSRTYTFLGFTVDMQNSTIHDNIKQMDLTEWHMQALSVLLTHYASANLALLSGKLIKFKDIPGGYAYEDAFVKRAVNPIAEVFGGNPDELVKAAKLLGGVKRGFGDASAEIAALAGIPLTYILWGAQEFAAEARILYDESASNYLPTEDLAVLGEVTSARLIQARAAL